MKTWISKVAIGAALAAVSTASMAAVDGGYFINGEVAGANVNVNTSNLQSSNTSSTSGALRIGYLWNQGIVSWGVETGFVTLGSVGGTTDSVPIGYGLSDAVRFSIRTHGELLGGNTKLHFGRSGWYVSGRLGWFHSQTSQTADDTLNLLQSQRTHANGDGAYAGVGLGYDFNKHIGISFNYDAFNTRANSIYTNRFTTSTYGGTFEYRF